MILEESEYFNYVFKKAFLEYSFCLPVIYKKARRRCLLGAVVRVKRSEDIASDMVDALSVLDDFFMRYKPKQSTSVLAYLSSRRYYNHRLNKNNIVIDNVKDSKLMDCPALCYLEPKELVVELFFAFDKGSKSFWNTTGCRYSLDKGDVNVNSYYGD